MDTDLGTSKHGTRFYRSLIGDAKDAAECGLKDEDIVGEEGFENILKFFDTSYTGFLEIADDVGFDNGLYSVPRGGETLTQFNTRKIGEFAKWQKANGALSDLAKGKLLLRHAKLSKEEANKVHTWLAGSRLYPDVQACLNKLVIDGHAE